MEEKEQATMAELIKKHRVEQGFTQTQLCEATGISISTLKKYETGLRHPKAEQLQKIADALEISEQVFMPLQVKNNSDILMTIMQLDKDADFTIDYKKNAEGEIIPETITFSFNDHELNKQLAEYITRGRRLISYMEKFQRKTAEKNED